MRTSRPVDVDGVRVFVSGPLEEPVVERYLGQAPFIVGKSPNLRAEVRATHRQLERLRYMGFQDARLLAYEACAPPDVLRAEAEAWCGSIANLMQGGGLYQMLDYFPRALNAKLVATWNVRFEDSLVHGDARHSPVLAATAMAIIDLYPQASADYLQAFEEWRSAAGLSR